MESVEFKQQQSTDSPVGAVSSVISETRQLG